MLVYKLKKKLLEELIFLINLDNYNTLKTYRLNLNLMRQSACLVFDPITVNNSASLFNCMPVVRASDSMMAPDLSYSF